MSSIRQSNGISGFTKRDESEYDPFGAGHSSTSISAALGMSVAADFKVSFLLEQAALLSASTLGPTHDNACRVVCQPVERSAWRRVWQ